jgi:hypothetical protein
MLVLTTEEIASNLKTKLAKILNLKKLSRVDREFLASLVNQKIFLLLPIWTKRPNFHPNPARNSKISPNQFSWPQAKTRILCQ